MTIKEVELQAGITKANISPRPGDLRARAPHFI